MCIRDRTCTVANHGLSNGDKVKLAPNSLSFTCDKDDNVTVHTYPRETDPIASQWVAISNKTTNTFRIQVLSVTPSTNTTAHTFVGSTTNGITLNDGKISVNVGAAKAFDQYVHTFVGVGTDAVVSGGNYTHHFIGTADKAVISGGDYNHSFVNATTGGVTVGVGTTTPTNATYDASTGDMVLTIPGHGAIVGTAVSFAINAITFTCSMDGNATNHSYPRATDPIIGIGSTTITSNTVNTITVNVGASKTVTHDVTDASYNPATGSLVLTSPNHGLKSGVSIRIPDNALTFTCDMDGNSTKHTYPRSTDPVSNTAISIASTTSNTLTVNVGTSTQVSYNVTAADYDASSGIMTMTVGSHNLTTGSSIKIAKESLTFSCTKDNNATLHKYPRSGDPYYNGVTVAGVNSPTKFDVNVGVATVPTYYKLSLIHI